MLLANIKRQNVHIWINVGGRYIKLFQRKYHLFEGILATCLSHSEALISLY